MGSDDDHENKFGFSRKIMIAAIVSFVVVSILIIILHLYSRYLLRRQERRRGRVSLYPATAEIALADVNLSVLTLPKVGLDQSIIASLPISLYKPTDWIEHGEAIECSVCLSTLEEEATVRLLPNCKHLFHAECIDLWLSSHLTCPICRTMAEPRLQLPDHSEPTAPPLEESRPDCGAPSEKVGGSCSRLSSFRRMLSRERSSINHQLPDHSEPTAPPLEESRPDCGAPSEKVGGSCSRLSSFRRIVSRERSSTRINQSCEEVGANDLERQ